MTGPFVVILVTLLLHLAQPAPATNVKVEPGHYLNEFAIRLKAGGREIAEEIAKEHGFIVNRELPNINVFILEHPEVHHRSKRSADNHLEKLQNDERIDHAQQEITLHRVKRKMVYDKQLELPLRTIEDESRYKRVEDFERDQRDDVYESSLKFSDPKFKDMWYLDNRGQSFGERGLDMNIKVVWENGFTGKGIVVTILDDGVDHTHPDLKDNFDPYASADLNDKSDLYDDPMPDTSDKGNSHGTRCAGEVAAAANNGVCGVGVAYEASIGGIRILDGSVTDSLEAEALRFNANYIDIFSASWGPSDDGATMEGPRKLAKEALQEGASLGRNGLGSIFVWATGNGGLNGDDCSCDGYVSLPETLSIGAVNEVGHSPFFTENCTSTLAVVPSGGADYLYQAKAEEEDHASVRLKVITTDMKGGCIENFQGTSSAAPLAAGCLANVLQANPKLSYRDVQHIVVQGSRIPSADNSWIINGAGLHVSHRFGFGLMNCGKMVALAQQWNSMPEQLICNTTKENYQLLKQNDKLTDTMYINGCPGKGSDKIDRLEHVEVYVKMSTQRRGNTFLVLVSPAGTKSKLLSPRRNDEFGGDWEFTFMTVHNWDESPKGEWILEVHDKSHENSGGGDSRYDHLKGGRKDSVVGYIKQWSLTLRGTHGTRHGRTDLNAKHQSQKAYKPTEKYLVEEKTRELELSKKVQVKRAQDLESVSESKGEVSENGKEERLAERLWNLLYNKGEETVEKRVLGTPEKISEKQEMASDKKLELREVIDELTNVVEKINARKAELKKKQLEHDKNAAKEKRKQELRREIEELLNSLGE